MFIRYRNHDHEPGELQLSVQKEVLETDAGTPFAIKERWDMIGMLFGDSQADIHTQVGDLLSAYSENGGDISLQLTSGGATHLEMLSANCIGGTKVTVRPSFPDNRNAAHVTFMPYTITVEGEVAVDNLETGILAWQETIVRSGGGPRYGLLEPLTGFPIRQLLKRNTIYHATQRGSAVGLYVRPVPPLALWPSALLERPTISVDSAKRRGSGSDLTYTEFPVNWSYEFESARPLIGNPHSWGTF